MNEKEIYYIKELKSQDKHVGYNLANGGTGGDTSEFIDYTNQERLDKIAEAVTGVKNGSYQKVYSESEKLERASFFDRNKKGNENPNYGRKASKTTKDKQSKSLSGKNNPNYGKCWCVKSDALNKENKRMFHKDSIPDGWISVFVFNKRV